MSLNVEGRQVHLLLETFSGPSVVLMVVKPTMSEKKMVTACRPAPRGGGGGGKRVGEKMAIACRPPLNPRGGALQALERLPWDHCISRCKRRTGGVAPSRRAPRARASHATPRGTDTRQPRARLNDGIRFRFACGTRER